MLYALAMSVCKHVVLQLKLMLCFDSSVTSKTFGGYLTPQILNFLKHKIYDGWGWDKIDAS